MCTIYIYDRYYIATLILSSVRIGVAEEVHLSGRRSRQLDRSMHNIKINCHRSRSAHNNNASIHTHMREPRAHGGIGSDVRATNVRDCGNSDRRMCVCVFLAPRCLLKRGGGGMQTMHPACVCICR